jgi:hypothetical protein
MNSYMSASQLSASPINHRRVTSLDHFGTCGALGLSISSTNLNEFSPHSNVVRGQLPDCNSHTEDMSSLVIKSNDMPKLMLLTVAKAPNLPCELQVQYNELHRVDSWLVTDDGSLDGVYLQYEEEMMTLTGAAYLRGLSERFLVGIWGYSGHDPDNFQTFEWLVKEGNCTFVNTDLPKHFR